MATTATILRRSRYGLSRVASAAAIVLIVVLATVVGLMLTGNRPLIVMSGSMSPTIDKGDLIVTRMVGPPGVRPGEIITFQDPSGSGRLITHRVLEIGLDGSTYAVVTRGDANGAEESWSIDADGTVGRMALRIPAVGKPLRGIVDPSVQVILLSAAAVFLGALAVRRIWW